MTLANRLPSARHKSVALIPALLALTLASCLSDEALTAPPPVDEPTAAPAFADAAHRAALGTALEDARTRLLPALQSATRTDGLEPAVRGLEAALAAQDAAAFTRRLPEAEAALAALEGGNAAILIELAAVGLAIEAAHAAVRAPAPADDAPSN